MLRPDRGVGGPGGPAGEKKGPEESRDRQAGGAGGHGPTTSRAQGRWWLPGPAWCHSGKAGRYLLWPGRKGWPRSRNPKRPASPGGWLRLSSCQAPWAAPLGGQRGSAACPVPSGHPRPQWPFSHAQAAAHCTKARGHRKPLPRCPTPLTQLQKVAAGRGRGAVGGGEGAGRGCAIQAQELPKEVGPGAGLGV